MGLIIVDATVKKVDWSAANTLVWLALLAILSPLGVAMIVAGSRGVPHRIED